MPSPAGSAALIGRGAGGRPRQWLAWPHEVTDLTAPLARGPVNPHLCPRGARVCCNSLPAPSPMLSTRPPAASNSKRGGACEVLGGLTPQDNMSNPFFDHPVLNSPYSR